MIAKAKARSDGSLASSAWANGGDTGYEVTYISMYNGRHGEGRGARGKEQGARQTYWSLLGRVVELARELVVQELLASKDVEEIWKGVEPVVKSGA